MGKAGRHDGTNDDLLRVGLFWPTSRTVLPSAYICEQNPDPLDVHERLRLARELEAAGFDFALLGDGYGHVSDASSRVGHNDPSMHAILWAPALFRVTTHLGLVSTMHPTFIETVDLAQYGAQLDHMSGGRWGWNVTVGWRPEEPKLFGASGLGDHDERYGNAEETVSACRQLWQEGKPEVHQRGQFRRFDGALPGPSPSHRRGPCIVSAGASEHGVRLAGRHCDYLFASLHEHSDLADLQDRLRSHGAEAGRTSFTKVLLGLQCFIRDDDIEARDEWEVIEASIAAGGLMGAYTASVAKGSQAAAEMTAKNQGVTSRFPGVLPVVGSPTSVAQQLAELYHDYGHRGFLFMTPYWMEGEMSHFGRMFDALEATGVWMPASKRSSLW